MGVLGDIAGYEWMRSTIDNCWAVENNRSSLPYEFLDRATQNRLIDLNDGAEWNFNEIADYIKQNIKVT